MRSLLILCFSLAFLQTQAQNSEISQTSNIDSNTTAKNFNKIPYRFIPKLSLLAPVNSVILIGIEKPTSARQAVEFSIGYIFDDFFNEFDDTKQQLANPSSIELDNSKANISLRLENKFFSNKQEYTYSKWYIAPEFFFNIRHYNSMHCPCMEITDTFFGLACDYGEKNRYTTIRSDFGGHVKGGFQKIYKSGFTIDMFAGLGLKYIMTNTRGKIEGLPQPENGIVNFDFGPPAEDFDDINKFQLSATIGFRIGYAFRR